MTITIILVGGSVTDFQIKILPASPITCSTLITNVRQEQDFVRPIIKAQRMRRRK